MSETTTLWVCDDCAPIIANGDYTQLAYWYSQADADRRMAEIDAGIDTLTGEHGYLTTGDGYDPYSTRPCECCGITLHGPRQEAVVIHVPSTHLTEELTND